jgi:hypothetical protein
MPDRRRGFFGVPGQPIPRREVCQTTRVAKLWHFGTSGEPRTCAGAKHGACRAREGDPAGQKARGLFGPKVARHAPCFAHARSPAPPAHAGRAGCPPRGWRGVLHAPAPTPGEAPRRPPREKSPTPPGIFHDFALVRCPSGGDIPALRRRHRTPDMEGGALGSRRGLERKRPVNPVSPGEAGWFLGLWGARPALLLALAELVVFLRRVFARCAGNLLSDGGLPPGEVIVPGAHTGREGDAGRLRALPGGGPSAAAQGRGALRASCTARRCPGRWWRRGSCG